MDEWVEIAQVASGFATLAMLMVWSFYLKLAYDQYREHKRPWFVIHERGDASLASECLLVNMGGEVAHVSSLVTVVGTGERVLARLVDGRRSGSGRDKGIPREKPLASGEVISLGTFGDLLEDVLASEGDGTTSGYEGAEWVEIQIVAAAPVDEAHPVGASRRFTIEQSGDGPVVVCPSDLDTRQMRSRKERNQVRAWQEQAWRHYGAGDWWVVEGADTPR